MAGTHARHERMSLLTAVGENGERMFRTRKEWDEVFMRYLSIGT